MRKMERTLFRTPLLGAVLRVVWRAATIMALCLLPIARANELVDVPDYLFSVTIEADREEIAHVAEEWKYLVRLEPRDLNTATSEVMEAGIKVVPELWIRQQNGTEHKIGSFFPLEESGQPNTLHVKVKINTTEAGEWVPRRAPREGEEPPYPLLVSINGATGGIPRDFRIETNIGRPEFSGRKHDTIQMAVTNCFWNQAAEGYRLKKAEWRWFQDDSGATHALVVVVENSPATKDSSTTAAPGAPGSASVRLRLIDRNTGEEAQVSERGKFVVASKKLGFEKWEFYFFETGSGKELISKGFFSGGVKRDIMAYFDDETRGRERLFLRSSAEEPFGLQATLTSETGHLDVLWPPILPGRMIMVSVTDENQTPVKGAVVSVRLYATSKYLEQVTQETDADGVARVRLGTLPSENRYDRTRITINTLHPDYWTAQEVEEKWIASFPGTQHITLRHKSALTTFTVEDGVTGEPLSNSIVEVRVSGGRFYNDSYRMSVETTGDDGRCSVGIDSMTPHNRQLFLRVSRPGYAVKDFDIPEDNEYRTLRLDRDSSMPFEHRPPEDGDFIGFSIAIHDSETGKKLQGGTIEVEEEQKRTAVFKMGEKGRAFVISTKSKDTAFVIRKYGYETRRIKYWDRGIDNIQEGSSIRADLKKLQEKLYEVSVVVSDATSGKSVDIRNNGSIRLTHGGKILNHRITQKSILKIKTIPDKEPIQFELFDIEGYSPWSAKYPVSRFNFTKGDIEVRLQNQRQGLLLLVNGAKNWKENYIATKNASVSAIMKMLKNEKMVGKYACIGVSKLLEKEPSEKRVVDPSDNKKAVEQIGTFRGVVNTDRLARYTDLGAIPANFAGVLNRAGKWVVVVFIPRNTIWDYPDTVSPDVVAELKNHGVTLYIVEDSDEETAYYKDLAQETGGTYRQIDGEWIEDEIYNIIAEIAGMTR